MNLVMVGIQRNLFFVFIFVGSFCVASLDAGYYDETKRRAAEGDPEAQEILSYMYEAGKGVPRDLEQARRWAALAAAKGRSGSRLSPRRPQYEVKHSAPRMNPRRPSMDTQSYQGVRMSPRRPVRVIAQSGVRIRSQRPSSSLAGNYSRAREAYGEIGTYQDGIRDYERGMRWHRKLSRGGKLLISPVTFTLKQSKRAVSKVFRKAALGSTVLY